MATIHSVISLNSSENEILLNPKWPPRDLNQLIGLGQWASEELQLKSHVWMATSGSTSETIIGTKLVALSKNSLRQSAIAVNKHLHVTSADIWTQVLPTFHVGGLGIEIRAEISNTKVVPALNNGRWDALYFYGILNDEKCTISSLVPTQLYDLVSLNLKAPERLRAVIIGGGRLDEELYLKGRQLGWPLLPSYGMTETASQIATAELNSLKDPKMPSMKILDHANVQITEDGFLKISADSLFTCYARISEDGFSTWNPKCQDWFHTEDKGEIISGHLVVQGRSNDYIKIGGEATNIEYLRSVFYKEVIDLLPSESLQITIIDMPSDRLGSEVHAVSTLSEKVTEEVICKYQSQVRPFERIRKIHFVNEIPRTELGKILWAQLKKKLNV